MKPWHEQDEFWEAFGPTLFSERHWSTAPVEVDGIISLLRLQPGMSIVDLCCGPGRHSLEFARRGFQVTAVDRTTRYRVSHGVRRDRRAPCQGCPGRGGASPASAFSVNAGFPGGACCPSKAGPRPHLSGGVGAPLPGPAASARAEGIDGA